MLLSVENEQTLDSSWKEGGLKDQNKAVTIARLLREDQARYCMLVAVEAKSTLPRQLMYSNIKEKMT